MHGRVVGELLGEAVPLAASTQAKDHGVQDSALVDAGAPGTLWWIVLFEDRLDLLPQLVWHAPDSGKRLLFGWAFGHWDLLFARIAEDSNRSQGFEIVS